MMSTIPLALYCSSYGFFRVYIDFTIGLGVVCCLMIGHWSCSIIEQRVEVFVPTELYLVCPETVPAYTAFECYVDIISGSNLTYLTWKMNQSIILTETNVTGRFKCVVFADWQF